MNITIIAAVGRNGEIGAGGELPWPSIPEDMVFFKKHTRGHAVVMGRKTWDSLPAASRPLPVRLNIVMSRVGGCFDGATVACSARRAIEEAIGRNYQEVFIIGGAEVYRAFLPMVDSILLTAIGADFPGADSFFPEWPLMMDKWVPRIIESSESLTFLRLTRDRNVA